MSFRGGERPRQPRPAYTEYVCLAFGVRSKAGDNRICNDEGERAAVATIGGDQKVVGECASKAMCAYRPPRSEGPSWPFAAYCNTLEQCLTLCAAAESSLQVIGAAPPSLRGEL